MVESSINILLVEDDEIDIMNIQRVFDENKISNPLYVARDGLEALAMLRGDEGAEAIHPLPRIILLDLNMPRMGGLEFLREMRKDPKLRPISVFVLTTSNHDQDKLEAFEHNVAGYILKPVHLESFVQAVAVLNNYWALCEWPEN